MIVRVKIKIKIIKPNIKIWKQQSMLREIYKKKLTGKFNSVGLPKIGTVKNSFKRSIKSTIAWNVQVPLFGRTLSIQPRKANIGCVANCLSKKRMSVLYVSYTVPKST